MSGWLILAYGWVCGCTGATLGIVIDNLIANRQAGGQK